MVSTAIVIPLLRQVDEWLEQCVESAMLQTVPCEVLVVTSPRTPESNQEVLTRLHARYPSLRVMEREPQMRFAAALNLGIRSTTAERVAFLLTDDWLNAEAVERAEKKDADIVSTQMRIFAADGVTVLEQIANYRTQAAYDALTTNWDRAAYVGHFLLIRRAVIEAVGGVDETIGDSPGVDDFDMIWCLLDRGASVAIAEEPLYHYRDHAGERLTTRRFEDMMKTLHNILNKHGVEGALREQMIRDHSQWFGKPILDVYQHLNPKPVSAAPPAVPAVIEPRPKMVPAALRPIQWLYRAVLPLSARIMIQERLLWWMD